MFKILLLKIILEALILDIDLKKSVSAARVMLINNSFSFFEFL